MSIINAHTRGDFRKSNDENEEEQPSLIIPNLIWNSKAEKKSKKVKQIRTEFSSKMKTASSSSKKSEIIFFLICLLRYSKIAQERKSSKLLLFSFMERKVIMWVKDKVIQSDLCWLKHTFSDDRYTQLKVTSFRRFIVFVWCLFYSRGKWFSCSRLFRRLLRHFAVRFDGDFYFRRTKILESLDWKFTAAEWERTVTESLENEIASRYD